MSSTGPPGPGSTAPKPYYCYQCSCNVSVSLSSPTSELVCPICNGGFLEEFDGQNPNPNPNPNPNSNPFFSDPFSSSFSIAGMPLVFSSSSGAFDLRTPPSSISSEFPRRGPNDPDAFNPFLFLQNYLQTLIADGANIQFVVDGGPANFGDYFIGPGLEQLIQHLAENDPNRYGTPPASKIAVEALPEIEVSDQLLASDSAQCAVCMDTFELGKKAKQLPCKHVYHPDCILPWLELHNSCPVCRYELPTDDPDYEHRTRGAPPPQVNPLNVANAAPGSDSGATAQGDSGGTPTGERRFRISLPWPFRAFGSVAETSNSGFGRNSENNNNDDDRNSNSGHRDGHQGLGSETRQEDLD